MAPKSSRGSTSGQLRTHSRSSSATKLGANLQFTQKELQAPKHADKSKKAHAHEAHPTTKVAPPFVRVNSSQRVHSKEQLALAAKRLAPQHQHSRATSGKAKTGFTIASPTGNADDDEGWVSTESGAATPNHQDSGSDTASEADSPDQGLLNAHPHPRTPQPDLAGRTEPTLTRVDTARPSDFKQLSRPPSPPKQAQAPQPPMNAQLQRTQADTRKEPPADSSHTRHSPRPRRYSRPPSTHSISSRTDHQLRPHPLIRGQSYGNTNPVHKPAPLPPLTVIPDAALPEMCTSPANSHDGVRHYMSTSPASVNTSSGSPVSADVPQSAFSQDRRTSFSSVGSVSTIPVHSTIIREAPRTHDRTRTLSTVSNSSSSAALSSLAHLPTVIRPPSPQTISFFPPVNPHANIEGIHPLLPNPYLGNHLTVLSRRTPIRESFDRVSRAKNAR